jgi:hypothetical protein
MQLHTQPRGCCSARQLLAHCTAQQLCGVGTEAGFSRSSGSSFSTVSSRMMMAGNCIKDTQQIAFLPAVV